MAGLLFWKMKFYWDTAMFIHLHVVYGCFHATMAELNSGDRERMAVRV